MKNYDQAVLIDKNSEELLTELNEEKQDFEIQDNSLLTSDEIDS